MIWSCTLLCIDLLFDVVVFFFAMPWVLSVIVSLLYNALNLICEYVSSLPYPEFGLGFFLLCNALSLVCVFVT